VPGGQFGAPAAGPPQYPYGGPPQYPYGQQPWPAAPAPQVRPYNGLAIASFVTALLLISSPVGLVLGIVALVQLSRREREGRGQQGRGLAIAGVAVSSVVLLLIGLGIAFGDSDDDKDPGGSDRSTGGTTTEVFDIEVGDCFDTGNLDKYEEGHLEESVSVKPCDGPHEAEAFGSFDIEGHEDFPGVEVLEDLAYERCGTFVQPYLLDTWVLTEELSLYYYHPEEVSWILDDREVLCFFGSTDFESFSGSLRATAEDFEPAQLTLLEITAELDGLIWAEPAEQAGLEDWTAWSAKVAEAAETQVAALRAADWADEETAALAGTLADAREQSITSWEEGSKATTMDVFWEQYGLANEVYGYYEEQELRGRLSLATG
jgi:hypothetical protein